MADTKTTDLTEITAPVSTDLVYVVGDPGGTPVSRKATLTTIRKTLMVDGWIEAGETWTYASADAPTFTFTISGDVTTKYSAGMRLKLTQTTIKYFIVTAVAYGAPNTTVTVYGGTDYTLANAAITLPYYSTAKIPAGFPASPAKWMVEVIDTEDRSQATPAQNTWYNLGSITISIPIGVWLVSYQTSAGPFDTTATTWATGITLSTANNSESDVAFSTRSAHNSATVYYANVTRSKYLTLAAKTSYYLNVRTETANLDYLLMNNTLSHTILRAVCAYL